MRIRQFINSRLNPDWYHGQDKKGSFFEGWYFKIVDASERHSYAFIPGIFINSDASKTHAFIQVLKGKTGKTTYHHFPFDSFHALPNAFDVRLDKNHFRRDHLSLHIKDADNQIDGELSFEDISPYPVTWTSPGIMGFFGWFPFMECNHGVVSLDHNIKGKLRIDGEDIDFTGGRGYIEKDWGSSFPSGYVWQQSNHFETIGTCLTASIAMIPNFGFTWAGFIIALWHNKQLTLFASYTGAKVEKLSVSDTHVEWIVSDKTHRLQMRSTRAEGGLLLGPEKTDMHKRVDETMQATIDVTLSTRDGQILFHETGRNVGLEVVGDIAKLRKNDF